MGGVARCGFGGSFWAARLALGLVGLFICGLGWQKETEEGRRSRKKNRDFIPFLSASVAVGVNSLSSAGMVLPASVFEAEGMGEREEGEGVPFW